MQDLLSRVAVPTPSYIVGIGASAGGLQALEEFFAALPVNTGLAFVVVQHLSPDFKSVMDDILSRRTTMRVQVVEDSVQVVPNTIYLNLPKKMLALRGGHLIQTDKDPSTSISFPIDYFFSTLANHAAGRAVAVVLSGTGSDGSRGIVDVHRLGGLVIAQDPTTAQFNGMPQSAIDSGIVDLTLSPTDAADAVSQLANGIDPRTSFAGASNSNGLSTIISLLRNSYGIDFAEYKLPTIVRRTERRIRMCGDKDLEQYAERLDKDREELDALYRDLLIGVTQLFRDREAFDALALRALPPMLRALSSGQEFRVWVAGCATGEEAYSLAILVSEGLSALGLSNTARIFATDIHHEALRLAMRGSFDAASVVHLSAERLSRYFVLKEDGRYQVIPSIRAMVVFAPHNVLHDVPFNKLDLVSCRNLLIYLKPEAQRRALNAFHFGLKNGGVLFLGASESLADFSDDFETLDSHWKIFSKRREVRGPSGMVAQGTQTLLRSRSEATLPLLSAPIPDPALLGTYEALLEELVPPSLLINTRRQLVHSFGGANRFLRVPPGRVTNDVVEMLHGDLRVAVTGAIQRALNEHQPIHYSDLRVDRGADGLALVDLTVRELRNRRTNEPYILVTFGEQRVAKAIDAASTMTPDALTRDQIVALEVQLKNARENLQTTIEELETSNEELQATNEELTASNEELQTTNEELHSVNQELFTINTEYQKKISELTELTSDMDLLLESTDVHTLFLDRELRIRRFTPRIAELFHLVVADVGRKIDTFNHSLRRSELSRDLKSVIATGTAIEEQVQDTNGSWFLLRVLPYRRGKNIEGAVLTLIDMTAMKRLEAEARSKTEQLTSILTNSPHPVFIRDTEGRYVIADESFRRLTARDPTGLNPSQLFSVDVAAMLTRDDASVLRDGVTVEAEETLPTPNGPRTFLSVKFPLRDSEGRIAGIGGIQTDVTSLKLAEAEARQATRRRDVFLATLSHELRNPLAAVLNAARVLTRGQLSTEELERWHTIIRERAEHMSRLVDELLDVARLAQDKLVLSTALLELGATMRGVVDEVGAKFRERGITLVVQKSEELSVLGDATRLHQLQVNLLTNAARHTPAGGTVTYTLRRADAFAELSVTDTGEGIAPDMIGRIFELFVQSGQPGARGYDSGLGVGLALVKRIAELHDGSVRVSSAGLGHGAAFIVQLPLAQTPEPSSSQQEEPSQERPQTVFVVDDDFSGRTAMCKLLELDGIEVTSASTGEQALERLATYSPALVLLDIGLPGIDGYEVCKRIRLLPQKEKLTIFALTGFGQDSDREASVRAGFDGHLTKPVDIDEIYALYARLKETGAKPTGRGSL